MPFHWTYMVVQILKLYYHNQLCFLYHCLLFSGIERPNEVSFSTATRWCLFVPITGEAWGKKLNICICFFFWFVIYFSIGKKNPWFEKSKTCNWKIIFQGNIEHTALTLKRRGNYIFIWGGAKWGENVKDFPKDNGEIFLGKERQKRNQTLDVL